MKRDIKLNISELREVYLGINNVKNALEEIEAASGRFQAVLKEQDSRAYEELSGLWEEKVQKEEAELKEKLESIAQMVNGYIGDMTSFVEPENETERIRVDRDDILWNYTQICGYATGFLDIVEDTGSSWKDYKKFYMYNPFLSAAENAGRKAALEEEEREERERREYNYEILEEFRKSLLQKMGQELPDCLKGIYKIYEENVVPFENTDDAYKKQLSEAYDSWAGFGDKAEDVWDVTVDVLHGVWDGLKDMVTGIWNLLKGTVEIMTWLDMQNNGYEVPEWLDEDVMKIFMGVEAIFADPGNALESIGQDIFDKADENGLAYSVSYVTADIVAGILLDKGLGKLGKAGKLDDVADTVGDISKYADDVEDLTGVGKHGTSVLDDGLRIPDYIKLSDELAVKLKADGYKVIDIEEASLANADWADMGYNLPPVAKGTKVYNVEAGNFQYARVFKEGVNNPKSPFILRVDDIKGLSAVEIAEKYALPQVPDYIVYPKIPPDTPLEVSIVGPQESWGTVGGDAQYAIKDVFLDDDWFIDIHPLE